VPSNATTLVGRLILALCALAALAATVFAALDLGPESSVSDWWRVVTLPVFAGLFALLAAQPRRGPWLWALVILNKAVLAIVGVALLDRGDGLDLLVADGALAVLLVVAMLLTRGWRGAEDRLPSGVGAARV
jgi:peptidoglycan/LPS O-acetylase OafA/YrhL